MNGKAIENIRHIENIVNIIKGLNSQHTKETIDFPILNWDANTVRATNVGNIYVIETNTWNANANVMKYNHIFSFSPSHTHSDSIKHDILDVHFHFYTNPLKHSVLTYIGLN